MSIHAIMASRTCRNCVIHSPVFRYRLTDQEKRHDNYFCPRKESARLLCTVTNSHDNVSSPIKKFVNELGPVPGNVDTDLLHPGNSQGVNGTHFALRSRHSPPQTCRHNEPEGIPRYLGAGKIVSTDEEYTGFRSLPSACSLSSFRDSLATCSVIFF